MTVDLLKMSTDVAYSQTGGVEADDLVMHAVDPGLALLHQFRSEAVVIPSGTGLLGTAHSGVPDDGVAPLRRVKLKPFRICATTVTNVRFSRFVEGAEYVTEAHRAPTSTCASTYGSRRNLPNDCARSWFCTYNGF